MYFLSPEAAGGNILVVFLRRSSGDQTTTLQDGELTRHRVIGLFSLRCRFLALIMVAVKIVKHSFAHLSYTIRKITNCYWFS